jgi:hypothetical protein
MEGGRQMGDAGMEDVEAVESGWEDGPGRPVAGQVDRCHSVSECFHALRRSSRRSAAWWVMRSSWLVWIKERRLFLRIYLGVHSISYPTTSNQTAQPA